MFSENVFLGNFSLEVQVQPDGKYDIYLAEDSSSGSHYSNLKLKDIGKIVMDEIDCYTKEFVKHGDISR